ncbi:hypothetical protein TURU_000527 [Turdus rufiventris]|nr:hypothetical protein TURU_000527 [Turdus rufiventris]
MGDDYPETATDVSSKLPKPSSPDSQGHRLRGSSDMEAKFFLKLAQEGRTEGDLDDLEPVWCHNALLGKEGEAGAHGCGWRDEAEGSLKRPTVQQDHLQQQEIKMEIDEESSFLKSELLSS